MAGASWIFRFCKACRFITYEMFAIRFEHFLRFEETVDFRNICKFCYLIVCTFNKI